MFYLSSVNYLLVLTDSCDYWLNKHSLVLDHPALDQDVVIMDKYSIITVQASAVSLLWITAVEVQHPVLSELVTHNSACKTNLVDKCSHNLGSSILLRDFLRFSSCLHSQKHLLKLLAAMGFDNCFFFFHLMETKIYFCWSLRLFLHSYLHLRENNACSSPFNSMNLLRKPTSQCLNE